MTKDQIITLQDLERFKAELLEEIKKLIGGKSSDSIKQWMKSAEVRELLGISPGKLQTMRNNKVVAFTRIGGNIYYSKDDITKMFESRKTVAK